MTAVLTIFAAAIVLLVGVPLIVFVLELLAGLWPGANKVRALQSCRTVVLIPAHDEAPGIAATIEALVEIAPPRTRILVVADNCSDDTAAVARVAGAEVLERSDAERRGKGYALAHGRDAMAAWAEQPDAVIVLDADCRFFPGSIEALGEAAMARQTPVQAVNLITGDRTAPPLVQISGFAMVVKNLFRSRGMQRMGGAALLTGTGMALPWPLFRAADLATGSLVEDLSLGVEMTRAGHPPRLIEAAQVRSAPASMADAMQQRRRWEHGFLETLRRQALPVLLGGLRRGSIAETLLGLHLTVPPLALLLMITAAALAACLALSALGASPVPAAALGLVLAAALVLVVLAWMAGGRPYLSGSALLRTPAYVLWKIPLYLSFIRKPETEWKRTPRDSG